MKKEKDEVIFIDSKGQKWNKSNLIELVEALHETKKHSDIVNYYFD